MLLPDIFFVINFLIGYYWKFTLRIKSGGNRNRLGSLLIVGSGNYFLRGGSRSQRERGESGEIQTTLVRNMGKVTGHRGK